MFENVIAALGANALVLAALAFLFKALISQRLQKDVLDFKNDIEKKAATEIESYRSQLERDRLRLQISYGGIFEKQANAILELYTAVVELENTTGHAIHIGGDVGDRRNRFQTAWHTVREGYQRKRILLPPEVDEAMISFLDKIMRGVLGYMQVEGRDLTRVSDDEFDRLNERQDRAMATINEEVPQLREKMISEMRRVIGVAADDF